MILYKDTKRHEMFVVQNVISAKKAKANGYTEMTDTIKEQKWSLIKAFDSIADKISLLSV